VLCAALAALAALPGCAPQARLTLKQPQLTGWQQEMRLASDQVYWAPGKDSDRVLAEFPLPGATTGRPCYLLYLRLPTDQDRPAVGAGDNGFVRGFFIQTRGEFAGKAEVKTGEVHVRGRSRQRAATRKLRFDLRCEDGCLLIGELTATRNDWLIQRFETQRRPADVEELIHPPPEP
jgi:hypothetical protein